MLECYNTRKYFLLTRVLFEDFLYFCGDFIVKFHATIIMNATEPVISLRDVAIYNANDPFGRLSAKKLIQQGSLVLSDVNLEVYPGELLFLIGRVGSGKSSLLKTLYAESPLIVGEGHVVGYNLSRLKQRHIPYLRRKMGIVFQDYQLLDDRNAYMNLHYVMRATGWRGEATIRNRIEEVLSLVDLESKSYKMPFELSGGEQQRLVIARALLNSPDLILADEPTGNLDPVTTNDIMNLFKKITEHGCAVVMSTHNTTLLESYTGRALLFSQGGISEIDLANLVE